MEKSLHKALILILKCIPMLLALCTIIDTMLWFFGINIVGLSIIGGVSFLPLLFLYLASYAFHFCEYHRMFLHYTVVNNVLSWFDFTIGLPITNEELFGVHIILIGLLLFLVLYFHQKEKCCKR